jgi:hypothetical protein
MTNTPETIAVFRTYEAKLDAELQRDRDLFSVQGISVKSICCREHAAIGSSSCIALEWGIRAEKEWGKEQGGYFVAAHFFFQEPWGAHDPLFLHCNVHAGRTEDGEKPIAVSRKHGGDINLIFRCGLGHYMIERMREVAIEIGQAL